MKLLLELVNLGATAVQTAFFEHAVRCTCLKTTNFHSKGIRFFGTSELKFDETFHNYFACIRQTEDEYTSLTCSTTFSPNYRIEDTTIRIMDGISESKGANNGDNQQDSGWTGCVGTSLLSLPRNVPVDNT